jgi:hypothetical protein
LPTQILKKIAPEKKLKRLIKGDLNINRAALSIFDDVDFIKKGDITKTALKTVKQYKKRYRDGETKKDAVADKKLMVHRVQSEVVFQIAEGIRDKYDGEFYEWLPSDADTPDPQHQLKYGKRFKVGVGEMPGDRIGCRCGMNILVKDNKLSL